MATFSDLAAGWLRLYGLHAAECAVFVLLIWACDKLCRLNTGTRYWLWLLALVKFLLPSLWRLPASLSPDLPVTLINLAPVTASSKALTSQSPFAFAEVLFCLWIISVALLSCYVLAQNFLLHRRLRLARPITTILQQQMPAARLATLQFFESAAIESPVLTGVRFPRLYLPADWPQWSLENLRSVLAHELAHLEHRDLWAVALQRLATILFAVHPLLWVVNAKLTHLRELRCDEKAITATSIAPHRYGRMLLDFAGRQSGGRSLAPAAIQFAARKKLLYQRFTHLLSFKEDDMKKIAAAWQRAILIVAGMALPLLSWQCGEVTQQPPAPEAASLAQAPINDTVFEDFDEAPQPLGGFAAIQKALKYPEVARLAGIEGTVFIEAIIDENGDVADTRVVKSMGNNGCDEAAVNAIAAIKWIPAKRQGKPVKVKVTIPIKFRLS